MNWLDLTVVAAVAGGLLFGMQRGILRQGALMVGFYVSLVLAVRYYGQAAGLLIAYAPWADPAVASAYMLAGLTLAGTLALGWLPQVVYGGAGLPRVPLLDRLAGAGLGAAWSW
ncbi:MAG TPA: CvpA family protein, partial [Chloroflexota bacterium]